MMKRFFALQSFLMCLSFIAVAQSSRSFRNTPLLEALQTIGGEQTEYSIDILSEGLADLRVTAEADSLSVPDAVELICRNLPVKVKVRGRDISVQYDKRKEVKTLRLKSKVEDIRAHKDLIGGTVEFSARTVLCCNRPRPRKSIRLMAEGRVLNGPPATFPLRCRQNQPITSSALPMRGSRPLAWHTVWNA